MNNADLIVATLKAAGIRHGFGIPSGNVLPLMEAMRKGGVEFVLTAHEGSAGFAADVSGRLTGAPGLAIATLGPGATNLATGVGSAWLDRSPMIAITCNLNTDQLGRRIQMWIDHHTLFKPITKATLRLERGRIAETVSAAIALAMTEPMGPVHLDLPEDVALAPATEAVPSPADHIAMAPAPDAEIARAAELIAAAKRPIAVIGSSAMRLADPSLLRKAIERHGLPFATTTMAKGLVDEDHRLSLGCIERACRQIQRKILHSADLIIGTRLRHHRGRIRSMDRRRSAAFDRHRSTGRGAVGQSRPSRRRQASTPRSRASLRCRRRPTAGRRRRCPIIAAHSSRRCDPTPIRSARMPRSTRCAARCRTTASFRSTSARIPIRSPVNGRRMRRRPS